MSSIDPVTLTGRYCRLEPIAEKHLDGLKLAIQDGELWKLVVTTVPHPDELVEFYHSAKIRHEAGEGLTFATIDQKNDKVVGSTRFMSASLEHKRIEIGTTFLSQSAQRTAVNSEAKLLMMTHAFEVLMVNRLELKTDYLNTISRTAILRLGAKEEGVLRNHMVMRDGRVRDTVMFSILKNDWAAIKKDLKDKLSH